MVGFGYKRRPNIAEVTPSGAEPQLRRLRNPHLRLQPSVPSPASLMCRRLAMAQRTSFAEMKAEQARITQSWKAEGRLSEAWVIADPEIVEIFSAGVSFGLEMGRRGDAAYSQDEWRKALREAVERAAALESKLETAKAGMLNKTKDETDYR
jgi:hypothetical protein